MLPMQVIKNHIQDIRDDELDQLLVSLYTTWQDQISGGYPVFLKLTMAERMKRFETWLDRLLFKGDSEQIQTLKVNQFFSEELVELHRIWDEAKQRVIEARETR